MLPLLKKINIDHATEGGEFVQKFIQNSVPNSVSGLYVNNSVGTPPVTLIDPYMDPLLTAIPKVKDDFTIYNFSISAPQLVSLITAAKNCRELGFRNCTLLTDSEIDFGDTLDDSAFSVLDFGFSGNKLHSDFADNPHRLKNVLVGLGKVQKVRENLKQIKLFNCTLKKEVVEQMITESGFTEVQLTSFRE